MSRACHRCGLAPGANPPDTALLVQVAPANGQRSQFRCRDTSACARRQAILARAAAVEAR